MNSLEQPVWRLKKMMTKQKAERFILACDILWAKEKEDYTDDIMKLTPGIYKENYIFTYEEAKQIARDYLIRFLLTIIK